MKFGIESSLKMQRKGSRCGGGVNMKCSVLQWSWKTLVAKYAFFFLLFCFMRGHTH